MLRRPDPEPLSPRALARLRASPRSYVPTERDLEVVPRAGYARGVVDAGPLAERAAHPLREGAGARHARARRPRGWVRMPTALDGARWQPGRAALVGVVLVVALAAAVFGVRVAWAHQSGEGTVIAPGGGSRAGPSGVRTGAVPVGMGAGSGSPAAPGGAPASSGTAGAVGAVGPAGGGGAPGANGVTTSAAPGEVVVHVVGQVRRPGVRRLPLGSRVADAVEAAGGATGKADLGLLNLARVLVDGEQVRVPAPGDPVAPAPTAGGGANSGGGTGPAAAGPVSLNSADLAALDGLPGVGPVLAQRILAWRSEHGRFASVDELGEVSGIGDKLLAQLSPLVTL